MSKPTGKPIGRPRSSKPEWARQDGNPMFSVRLDMVTWCIVHNLGGSKWIREVVTKELKENGHVK